jgi:hypothetical protein
VSEAALVRTGLIGLDCLNRRIEDCIGELYHHTTKMEQMMEHLLAKNDSNPKEMKSSQKEMIT